jgi:gluconolactonase
MNRTLRLAAVLAGLAASAAPARAQEARTPAIPGVFAEGTAIEVAKGDLPGHTEGPVGMADGSLLFASPPENRIWRIAPDGGASVYLEGTEGANGLAFDARGRLLVARTGTPQIVELRQGAEARVLSDRFQGRPFSRPNDLLVDRNGGIFFTDPGSRPADGAPLAQPSLVFHLSPSGDLRLIDDRMRRPNGVQLSPDERTLYIVDTLTDEIVAYDVEPDGTARNRRVFARLREAIPHYSGGDGMAVDAEGRLYVTSRVGLQVFGPGGEHLGTVTIPSQPTNLAFAAPDKKTLFMTTQSGVYKVRTLTPGVARLGK